MSEDERGASPDTDMVELTEADIPGSLLQGLLVTDSKIVIILTTSLRSSISIQLSLQVSSVGNRCRDRLCLSLKQYHKFNNTGTYHQVSPGIIPALNLYTLTSYHI